MSRKLGVTEQQIVDLPKFETSSAYSDLEKLVLRYTVAMSHTPVEVPDDLFENLRQHFSEKQMVELTSSIAWENYRARFDHALGIEAEGFSVGAVCAMPDRGHHAATDDVSRAHLRVARPTDNMPAVIKFYRDGLGFDLLSEFKDHDGFDGVMLGRKDTAYHLEFTRRVGHQAGRAPTADNLLVFYMPDTGNWQHAIARLEKAGYQSVPAFNPYWDKKGKTFEDPDGYRIVLQNAKW